MTLSLNNLGPRRTIRRSIRRKTFFISTAALALGFGEASAQNIQLAQELPPITVERAQRSEDVRPTEADATPRPRPGRQPDTQPTQPKVIEATSPTLVATPVTQVPNAITVITGTDLQRDQLRTVNDALRSVPGLNLVQTGGPGGQTSIFMRGTNSNHTKIIIDGIDVGDPSSSNGAFDLGQLTTADIDRIEVLRGPQSGLYGSDAIGGVISITTKKGQGPARVTAMVEGGSRDTINGAAGVSGSNERFNYAFNVSNYKTGSTPVTPLEILPPGRQRNNDDYRNSTATTKLGYDFSDQFGLNFVARYTDSKLYFTTDDFLGPGAVQSSAHARSFFTRGEAVWSLADGRFKNYFGVNYAELNRLTDDPNSFSGPQTTTNGERLKYDWRGVVAVLPGQTLVLGAEHEKERFDISTTFNPFVSADRSHVGGFAELQSNFANVLFINTSGRTDNYDTFGSHSTYRIAPAVIVPGVETKLKASYGTGFKAPTLSQLYDTTFASNNPNLRPEESRGYDVGFEQPLFNNRVRFGTTYFRNDIDNLINFGPGFVLENIQKARTSGFETFAAVAFTERFSVRFDHTYTKAIDATTNLELLRRPQNKASVSTIWTPVDPLTLSATVIATSDSADFDRVLFTRIRNPGYTIVNLAANYTVAQGVTVFGRVDNLFDQKYQNPAGFLNPRLGVFGGVRFASW